MISVSLMCEWLRWLPGVNWFVNCTHGWFTGVSSAQAMPLFMPP